MNFHRDDYLVQKLRDAVRQDSERDPHERFQEMINRGDINEKGEVLRRMPEPPEETQNPTTGQ